MDFYSCGRQSRCANCNTVQNWEWEHPKTEDEIYREQEAELYQDQDFDYELELNYSMGLIREKPTEWNITTCANCKKQWVFNYNQLINPLIENSIEVDKIDFIIQYPRVEKLWDESVACAKFSPRAGLTLSRMCVECLAKDILIEVEVEQKENFLANIKKMTELHIIDDKIEEFINKVRVVGNKSTHNFTLIDTEKEVTLDDCRLVWQAINYILGYLKRSATMSSDLSELEDKLKGKQDIS